MVHSEVDAVRFAKADALANTRHGSKANALLRLMRLVLDFDFNHGVGPWSRNRDRGEY